MATPTEETTLPAAAAAAATTTATAADAADQLDMLEAAAATPTASPSAGATAPMHIARLAGMGPRYRPVSPSSQRLSRSCLDVDRAR